MAVSPTIRAGRALMTAKPPSRMSATVRGISGMDGTAAAPGPSSPSTGVDVGAVGAAGMGASRTG